MPSMFKQYKNKKVDEKGRVYLPKFFYAGIIKELGAQMCDEGIVLIADPTKADDAIIIKVEKVGRTILPREMLRVYDNPNMVECSYINNRIDRLLLRPWHKCCCKCGGSEKLIELNNEDVFVCANCLNEAFDIKLKR